MAKLNRKKFESEMINLENFKQEISLQVKTQNQIISKFSEEFHKDIKAFILLAKNEMEQNKVNINNFSIPQNIVQKIEFFQNEIERCQNQLIGCELHLKAQQQEILQVQKIHKRPHLLETKKNNIVLHGFKVEPQQCLIDSVKRFFLKVLHVKPSIVQARRVKNKEINHPPVIVTVADAVDKRIIFGNAHRLKNYKTKISITDDLSKVQRNLFTLTSCKNLLEPSKDFVKDNLRHKINHKEETLELPKGPLLTTETTNILDEEIAKPVFLTPNSHCKINIKNKFTLALEKMKDDYFVCSILTKLHKNLHSQSNQGAVGNGLLARIISNRREARPTCNCKADEDVDLYNSYIESKGLDPDKTKEFIFKLNKTRQIFWKRWKDSYCKDKCYCAFISIEEMLICPITISNCYEIIKPVDLPEDDKITGNLFD
jgi:hypothetical protein